MFIRKSLKIKIVLIAVIISCTSLLLVGIITLTLAKNSLREQIIQAQSNYLRDGKTSVEDFDANNNRILKDFISYLQRFPIESFSSDEVVLDSIGRDLNSYRHAGHLFAIYLGLKDGQSVVSDITIKDTPKYAIIRGKADKYDATSRGWYIGAMQNNGYYKSPYYEDFTTKELVITYSAPLYIQNQFIGVVGIDVNLQELSTQFQKTSGRTFAFDEKGVVFVTTVAGAGAGNTENLRNKMKTHGEFKPFIYRRPGSDIDRFGMCSSLGKDTVCITRGLDILNEPVLKISMIQLTVSIVIILINAILLYLAIQYFIKPIATIQKGLDLFFDYIGHKTLKVSPLIQIKSQDELGRMAEAINSNIQRTQKSLEQDSNAVAQSVQTAKAIEQGDLSARIME
ncbi:cache domain-containing protein, partial [Helicobacter muridarum]